MNPGANPSGPPASPRLQKGRVQVPGASHHLAPSAPEAPSLDEAPPELPRKEEVTPENPPATTSVPAKPSPKRKLDWEKAANEFPFALVIFDSAQEILFENEKCRELAGFGVLEEGGIEQWLSALCPDEQHRKEVLESWQSHVWANQVTRTFSLRLKDNKIREIEFRSTLKEDGGISVVLEDVTDQLRAEANRQHSKLKFRALFTETENGTVLADRTGRIIDANPAFIELVEIPLPELRMSTLAGLLHPRDAEELEMATKEAAENEEPKPISKQVFLRSRSEEKQVSLRYCPIGSQDGLPSMAIYVFETNGRQRAEKLTERINIVSKKAAALLNAVPDLIFLINEDLTIADFAPPPTPWEELETPDSWRGASIEAVWPVLGEILAQSQDQIIHHGKSIRANVARAQQGPDQASPCEFSITASSGGDGQLLVIVRNQNEARSQTGEKPNEQSSPEKQEQPEPPSTEPLRNEAVQHSFRNQLQLVTSLFSLEPQGAAARDSFLRWQIRLRALAHAAPLGDNEEISLAEMLRNLSHEVCALTEAGPSRRAVVVSGSPYLKALSCDACHLALMAGELMRLVLATPQKGRGPEIVFELDRSETGDLKVSVRAGENRLFLSTDEDSEVETLEILASQMRGEILMVADSCPGEWKVKAPILCS